MISSKWNKGDWLSKMEKESCLLEKLLFLADRPDRYEGGNENLKARRVNYKREKS